MIWIAGAVCVDIIAMRKRFIDGTSNPSTFRVGLGGVGYNIFRSCRAPARFITTLGRDPLSGIAREALRAHPGVLVRESRQYRPMVYAAFMEDGKLKVGASDLSALEVGLDLEYLLGMIGEPGEGDILVLDGNLCAETVRGAVERLCPRVRVLFEPVSVEKALRHRSSLKGCWLCTPSEKEAAALVRGEGARSDPLHDAEILAWMSEAGPANLLVTRGERGASLYADGARADFPPGRAVRTGDSTGAGDLLVAALLGLLHQGKTLKEAIAPAMAVVESALEKIKP
jgi:sugar/nucleoside kinase (ribokinase family)